MDTSTLYELPTPACDRYQLGQTDLFAQTTEAPPVDTQLDLFAQPEGTCP